ncbi:hypothetical protein M5D96_006322 [Drosophila gunungcola]|uniref:SLC26A/SulP transporter domain-containing protein n=1 Tax=Drosophila gunungcola TaxID=103775 RepID=A0A9Q0BPX4_9MUSC|nr:hypothetical protein M5D96_006322 [Drosophila gunungcola]
MTLRDWGYRLLPGLKWLHGYTGQDAVADLIAGVTPRWLGWSHSTACNSLLVGGIVYAMLGSCRQVTIGPRHCGTDDQAAHCAPAWGSGPAYAILLCLISGVVGTGHGSAEAGALAKRFTGLRGGSGSDFIHTMRSVFGNLHQGRKGDFTLGLGSITVLLLLAGKIRSLRTQQLISGSIWVIATGRNALVVLVTSVLAYSTCEQMASCPYILTGKVKSGLPNVSMPKFETTILDRNGTEIKQNFEQMLSELGPSIILPIIAVLGNVAISKAFGGAGLSPRVNWSPFR